MSRGPLARGAALALGLLLAACALLPGGGDLSVDREREITDDVARQIRNSAPLVTDPVLLAYVNEIGQSLVRSTEPQPFLYRFSILRDDTLNAFTIGGGHVYLNSGVIERAGNVSELAGVMAHEIAHVRQRHIAKRAEGQGLTTLATLAATAAVAVSGADPGLLVMAQGLNVALQLRNSRDNEAEADREGLGYMVRSGYEPEGMVRFFERIVAEAPERGSKGVPSYLFTHPAVEDRIRVGRGMISRMERPPDLKVEDPRLAQMQDRLAMLTTPMAGGSGLQARAAYDRGRTEPLLERASQAQQAKNLEEAAALLAEAAEIAPSDPRVPLARADVFELRGDLRGALRQLRRAFEIDPSVPLVQFRLGDLLRRLGNRSEAVFYLEQAAANTRAGSLQKRAEELLRALPFPPLTASRLSGDFAAGFRRGETIAWDGELGARFAKQAVMARWIAPDASVLREDVLQPSAGRSLRATLETGAVPTGSWTLEISVGDVLADSLRFALRDAAAPAPDPAAARP